MWKYLALKASCLLILTGCLSGSEYFSDSEGDELPLRFRKLDIGLKVSHSSDTVYATINTKDPKKKGRFQICYKTCVESLLKGLTIKEFGAYFRDDNEEWEFQTIFKRPFNRPEFEKWYSCPAGILEKGVSYCDSANWIRKSNDLTGDTLNQTALHTLIQLTLYFFF